MTKAVLTTGQAAALCGVSVRTLKRWLERGELAGYRLPGSGEWRIPRPELAAFMETHGIPLGDLVGTKRRVLLVGTDPGVRAVLSQNRNLQVESAATGYEACLKAGEFQPHAVIIDLSTRSADGLKVAQAVRGNTLTRRAKLLFLGPRPGPRSVARLKGLAHTYLARPYDEDLLLRTLSRLVGLPL